MTTASTPATHAAPRIDRSSLLPRRKVPEFDTADDFEYWLRAFPQFRFVRCEAGPQFFMRRHAEAGSIALSATQTIAIARARCRHVLPPQEVGPTLSRAYFEAAWIHRENGKRRDAVACAWKAVSLTPWHLRCWKASVVNTLRWGLRR